MFFFSVVFIFISFFLPLTVIKDYRITA